MEESVTAARWEAAWALRRAHGSLDTLDTLESRAADDADADAGAGACAGAGADHAAAPRSYRVASLRGGTHPFDSREVNAALANPNPNPNPTLPQPLTLTLALALALTLPLSPDPTPTPTPNPTPTPKQVPYGGGGA